LSKLRIGNGFDVHRLVKGRKLILGGVHIKHDLGLDGHSDADVLLHAIADALLGAAGLPDIGYHFPPDDPGYKDADSLVLLRQVGEIIRQAGCDSIENIDSVLMAEHPKLLPYIDEMRQRIALSLSLTKQQVSVKATTCEKLGLVGRQEGIAASTVCLISMKDKQ